MRTVALHSLRGLRAVAFASAAVICVVTALDIHKRVQIDETRKIFYPCWKIECHIAANV